MRYVIARNLEWITSYSNAFNNQRIESNKIDSRIDETLTYDTSHARVVITLTLLEHHDQLSSPQLDSLINSLFRFTGKKTSELIRRVYPRNDIISILTISSKRTV